MADLEILTHISERRKEELAEKLSRENRETNDGEEGTRGSVGTTDGRLDHECQNGMNIYYLVVMRNIGIRI